LLIGDSLLRAAIVVGVASSAFTVFVVPDSVAATPRKVIGGHFVAIVIAMFIIGLLGMFGIQGYSGDARFVVDIAAAMSVGIGIIAMVVTNTEHPPAAGTSLGLIIHSFDWTSIVFILSSVVLLSILRMLLRGRMINLL
jgi:CBS-domain-containing membrane protein